MKLPTFIKVLEQYLDAEIIAICYSYYIWWWREVKWEYMDKDVVNVAYDNWIMEIFRPMSCKPREIKYRKKTTSNLSIDVTLYEREPLDIFETGTFAVVTKHVNQYLLMRVSTNTNCSYNLHLAKEGVLTVITTEMLHHAIPVVEHWTRGPIMFAVDLLYHYMKKAEY